MVQKSSTFEAHESRGVRLTRITCRRAVANLPSPRARARLHLGGGDDCADLIISGPEWKSLTEAVVSAENWRPHSG
jgi:hypothetical protein